MFDFMCSIIEFFPLTFLTAALLSRKFFVKDRLYAFIPFFILGILYTSFVPLSWTPLLNSIFFVILHIITYVIYFQIPLQTAIICDVLGYILIFFFQLVYLLFCNTFFDIPDISLYQLSGAVYTLLVAILLYCFCPVHKFYSFLTESGRFIAFILVNLFSATLIFTFYSRIQPGQFMDILIFLFISFCILLGVNLILLNQFLHIQKQKKKLQAYEEYMPMVDQLIHSVRVRQHRHQNEIQSIRSLVYTSTDYNSLRQEMLKYLDIMQFTSEPDYLLKLNKKLLSGFFYQKACAAKKDGREICYHFHSYMLNSEIPEYDLIEYFGILIDNALEAISMGEHIDVTIDCVENHIHFSTRNSGFTLTSKDRENFFQKGYSSKPDGTAHSGIGLTRLRDALLHEHNGTLGLWNEGTDIVFELII